MTFEIHSMKTCEKCRETYRHLQSDLPTIANGTTDMRSEEIARSLSKRTKKRKAAAAGFAVIFCLFAMLSLLRGQGDHDNRSLNHGRRDSKLSRRSDFQRAWSFSCVMVLHAEAVSANILHGKAARFFGI